MQCIVGYCYKYTCVTYDCFCAPGSHIRMISEESCDTEDWSNNAENSALITEINYILQYILTENS